MTARYILSAIGQDRPGLTQDIAKAVLAAGGNWLESRLSHLGGHYVGAVLVEIAPDQAAALEAAAQQAATGGVHIAIVAASDAGAAPGEALELELVGQDRPGIVHEVTAVLARLGANIEDFTSAAENSAWSGELLFRAQARLSLPPAVTADAVRAALEAISGDIMVDFTFGPRPPAG